jgi:putative ABC transport system permease protein
VAMAGAAKQFPNLNIESRTQFRDRLAAQIDQLLAAVNLLVVLAVIIALMGITNTLALAVFERTRELGLLRAVGMSRRSMRRMIRWEAALIALFGTVLGVVTGVALGAVAVAAMPAELVGALVVPTGQLVTLSAIAVVAAIVAAQLPARRAARISILSAIAN